MSDFFRRFVKQINIEKYIKNANGRKIIIWGASTAGKALYDILLDEGQEVYAFVDKKIDGLYFNGMKVEPPEFLKASRQDYYVIIATNYYKEIELFLLENNYYEIQDYLYIMHKPIYIEKDEEYVDIYGDNIKGIKGTNINFIGYNNKLKMNLKQDFEDNVIIYSNNSNIEINCDVNFDKTFIQCDNGNISIGSKCSFKEAQIYCNNSSINIDSECFLGSKVIINAHDESNIKIGAECKFFEKISIYVAGKSNLDMKSNCWVEQYGNISATDSSSIDIGKGCSFKLAFLLFTKYFGKIEIEEDCMVARHVTIGNNDAHPIFDIKTKNQINKLESIFIGKHVWLGNKCTLLSGTKIGNGSIVGANSLVKKKFPNNCIIAGNPANIKRKNVAWDRSEINYELIDKRLYWDETIE